MKVQGGTPRWYLDGRESHSTEQVSLDITRHLPRRLAVGTAVVVNDRPGVFLAVIRKRWMYLVREVEKQRSSTLDRTKRQELTRELERLGSYRFTADISHAHADALLISPAQTVCELPLYNTLYITYPITEGQFTSALDYSLQGALVVVYGEWRHYEQVMRDLCVGHLDVMKQYGQDTYPDSKAA